MDSVELSLIEDAVSNRELHELVRQHYLYTRSELAHKMLNNWDKYVEQFIQVVPIEYIKVLQEEKMKKLQERVAAQQTEF